MRNFFRVLGLIALIAVVGFSMAACSDDSGGSSDDNNTPGGTTPEQPTEDINLKGTVWKTKEYEFPRDGEVVKGVSTMTFDESAMKAVVFTDYTNGDDSQRCTYTVKGNTVTINIDVVTRSFVITGNSSEFPFVSKNWPCFQNQTFVKQ
jgi:hypothetical protein